MRKPRDIDAELKALQDKQRSLKLKRISQFGELVTATGSDALDLETLAGALLDAVERAEADPSTKEAWQQRGQSFFRRERQAKANGTDHAAPKVSRDHGSDVSNHSSAHPR
jgi:DNA-binding protein H-NS